MYFLFSTKTIAHFMLLIFVVYISIFVNKISAAAGYCYQCNSRSPFCRIDANATLRRDGTPCNGQCYTRISRSRGNILYRGCSWEHGFMAKRKPKTLILERNSVWFFCDTPYCNFEATALLNSVCFQPLCSFLRFPYDCRLPNADITCGRFCGNILCGSRPLLRRPPNRIRYYNRVRPIRHYHKG